MKMQKKQLLIICIIILNGMIFHSCTKVNHMENLGNSVLSESNSKYFYYYENKKRPLVLNTEYINVITKKKLPKIFENIGIVSDSYKSEQIKLSSDNDNTRNKEEHYTEKIKLIEKATEEDYLKIIKNFQEDPNVQYVSPYFEEPQGLVSFSNFFRVKLFSEGDVSILTNVANNYGVSIYRQNEYMPLWYTLECTNVNQSALDMANAFYQTGLFSDTEPDFYLFENSLGCPSDPLFSTQWGSKNTGQFSGVAGIDIKACEALELTRVGAIIDVAVIDRGIEFNHEDLISWGNMKSFNSETGTSPSEISLTWSFRPGNYSHGVACAGIIGASENGIGITGVAPFSRLMSVSHSFSAGRPNAVDELAGGVNWSWQNGAEVLNLSWFAVDSKTLNDAISNALIYGRNGKGCIVVCAAGNLEGPVAYPARSNPGIIAVGSINQCGKRQGTSGCENPNNVPFFYESSYGNELDIVAPGIRVVTTDMMGSLGYTTSNYMDDFGGTSSAAPHVAGVAALILSKNPTLMGYEVRNIIENTAQKVGGYSYGNYSGRNNGTWHPEMGYGLVNAYAAVLNTTYLGVLSGYEYYAKPNNH